MIELVTEVLSWTPRWYILIVLLLGLAIAYGLKAFFVPYLTEYGKRWATREDAQNILRELEKTTALTKKIEADVAGQLWVEQEKWKFKAELYSKLLEDLSDLYETTQRHEHVRTLANNARPQDKDRLTSETDDLRKRAEDLHRLISRSRAGAAAFLGPEGEEALEHLTDAWDRSAAGGPKADFLAAVARASQQLATAAGQDLKLSRLISARGT